MYGVRKMNKKDEKIVCDKKTMKQKMRVARAIRLAELRAIRLAELELISLRARLRKHGVLG
jgi:hypothetical protein